MAKRKDAGLLSAQNKRDYRDLTNIRKINKKGGKNMAKKRHAGKRGTTKAQKVASYHKQGLSTAQIARKAGTTLNSARWYMSKQGLKAHKVKGKRTSTRKITSGHKRTGTTKRELVARYHKQGMSTSQIAKKAGTTLNSARWYMSKSHLKANRQKGKSSPKRVVRQKTHKVPKKNKSFLGFFG